MTEVVREILKLVRVFEMENLLEGSEEWYCEVMGLKGGGLDAKVQNHN